LDKLSDVTHWIPEMLSLAMPAAQKTIDNKIHPNRIGQVYSPAVRRARLGIADGHGLTILADEVYGDLGFDGPVPLLSTLDRDAAIISLSSLSKAYLAPGSRYEKLRRDAAEVVTTSGGTFVNSMSKNVDLLRQQQINAVPRGARYLLVEGPRVPDRVSWLPAQARHLTDVQALREVVPDVADHDVYLCGSDGWMSAARAAVIAAGVPRDAVHLERFPY